ncbi:BA14K family protein [Rhodopseudomonas palustris]|uniref:Lectin-like protein BA14k n=1 Tax=Rhodopseudomonas palustris (strain BisB18) TaxID=316056 RepID=Q217D7_RHOPB
MKIATSLPTMALILGSLSFSMQPATAAPTMPQSLVKAPMELQTVQYRHGWHNRHGGSRHGGWRRGYDRRGYGPGVVGGLAAGALIGGAIANSQARGADADAYCSQRFKSYDPGSGTYLGYDGQRHPCP